MLNEKKHITLKLSDNYTSSIFSRASIINLFSIDLSNVGSLEIDLSNAAFLSRSPAHQLLTEKERLQDELKIKVEFSKVNKTVKEMLDVVEKSRKTPKMKTAKVDKVEFSTEEEFEKFLSQI